MDCVAVARAILDYPGEAVLEVLSLAPGLPPVTVETSVSDARRNYMRLAALVHPDKMKDRFEKSTEAFQKLVHAFEVLADPKSRKRLISEYAKTIKKQSQKQQRVIKQSSKKMLIEDRPETKKQSVAVKRTDIKSKTKKAPPAKKVKKEPTMSARDLSDDDYDLIDDDEDTYETDEDEDEDEESYDSASADAEPTVSTNRTPIGNPRTGGIYCDKTISCPRCLTPWQPDMKQQYTLFMGPTNKRVHCQLCLLRFGCATAHHACPHCQCAFDYDVSMYDKTVKCERCRKEFGFPYYPINQQLIDQVRLEEWRESQEAAKAHEREQRAARRHRSSGNEEDKQGDSEEFKMLLGQCIVDEQCPICGKRVTRSHSAHLKSCMEKKQKANKRSTVSKPSSKSAALKRSIASKGKQPQTKKPANKTTKKRRRSDSSDSEDDFVSSNDDLDI